MVEEDAYCMDVLKQLQAVQGAIGRVNALLLQDHLQTCVTTAIRGDDEQMRVAVLEGPEPAAPKLFLQVVPEPKRLKNRAHLDLIADDYSVDLDRISALGGTILNVNSTPDGKPSAVMADPEGNEFCLS